MGSTGLPHLLPGLGVGVDVSSSWVEGPYERLLGLQVRVPLEEPPLSPDMEEDDDLGKTLAVSRFGDLISKPPAWDPEKPSRSYSERDFECG